MNADFRNIALSTEKVYEFLTASEIANVEISREMRVELYGLHYCPEWDDMMLCRGSFEWDNSVASCPYCNYLPDTVKFSDEFRLYNNNIFTILPYLDDEAIDLIVTDPPYPVISGGTPDDPRRPRGVLEKNDGKIFEYNSIAIEDYMPHLFRVLKDKSHIYIFTNEFNIDRTRKSLKDCGFHIHNTLVAHKKNKTPNRWGMKNAEYVILARKGKAKALNDCSFSTVHDFGKIIGPKTHPTEKPVSLFKTYIANSSKEGDFILDPFIGTGASAIAAVNLNRLFIGCEVDSAYFDIAVERLRKNA